MKKLLLLLIFVGCVLYDLISNVVQRLLSCFGRAYGGIGNILCKSWAFILEWKSQRYDIASLFTCKAAPFWLVVLVCLLLFVLLLRWVLIIVSKSCGNIRQHVDDEPIDTIQEDCLGRMPYVKSLREIVKSWDGVGAQVVGVYGEWGEGKTSVINLFDEQYCRGGMREFDIVRFFPWHSVRIENMHSELFKCMGVQLGILHNPYLALSFMGYARKTASHFMLASDGISDFLLSLLTWGLSVLSSKDSIKECIREHLKLRKRRLIVVIDDLDRLSKEDALNIIRCIKTHADFPNTTYFLLSDADRLANIVKNEVDAVEKGSFYLEKIVQCPYPLWPVGGEILRKKAISVLNGVLKVYNNPVTDDLVAALDFCLEKARNLRQIKRMVYAFNQSLAYYYSMVDGDREIHSNGTSLNIELGDALRLAALRVIEPSCVKGIYNFYENCINKGSIFLLSGCIVERDEYNRLCDSVSKANKEWVRTFLAETMLIDEKGDAQYPDSIIARGIKDDAQYVGFRLASPKSFRRYFNSAELQGGLIPRKDRSDLLNCMLDDAKIQDAVTCAHRKWRLFHMLEVIITNNDYKVIANGAMAFVHAADYIIRNLNQFEAYEDSKKYRLAYDVCELATKNLERLRMGNRLSPAEEIDIANWIVDNKAYVVGLFFLYYGGVQFEPTFQYQPSKIDGVVAEKLWEWIKEELSCKIFEKTVEDSPEGMIIQKFFMLILLERLPVDLSTFKDNCNYFISSMDSPLFACRLKSLVTYNWILLSTDESITRRNLIAQHRIFFMNVLTKAEKFALAHRSDVSIEDLRFLQEMGYGYQTEVAGEMSKLYKERLGK